MPLQFRMKTRPAGVDAPVEWMLTSDELPDLKDGQVHLKLAYISIDPGMKGWITDKKSYMPAIDEGDVMRAFGVGEVVASKSDALPVGSFATGFTGVQTDAVLDARGLRAVDPTLAPLSHYMSGLGMPGYTGFFGMSDLGQPAAGKTIVVSACAGAVGSIASQTAKLMGARVIGVAGGPEKCAWLADKFGLDGAIDYKAGNLDKALREMCPDGVDTYFDNVGGDTLDAVLMHMNRKGRIVLCGGISQYGDIESAQGPSNYLQIVTQSLSVHGFTMMDYFHRIPEAVAQIAQWQADGKMTFSEHIVEGFDQFPDAFNMIFEGRNFGKLMIKV